MKSAALHGFRSKLTANEPVYGLWVTLEAAAIADVAAGLGFDWIGIDASSGHLDWLQVQEHVRATARSETVALVRIADGSSGLVRRAIQLGADGILMPRPENVAQLQLMMKHIGIEGSGKDPAKKILVGLVIDPSDDAIALRNFKNCKEVDFFFFESSVEVKDRGAIKLLVAELRRAGNHAGILATTDQEISQSLEDQFRVLSVGVDVEVIRRGIQKTLSALNNANEL